MENAYICPHLCHDVTNFAHFLFSVRGHIAPRFQCKWIRGDLVRTWIDPLACPGFTTSVGMGRGFQALWPTTIKRLPPAESSSDPAVVLGVFPCMTGWSALIWLPGTSLRFSFSLSPFLIYLIWCLACISKASFLSEILEWRLLRGSHVSRCCA